MNPMMRAALPVARWSRGGGKPDMAQGGGEECGALWPTRIDSRGFFIVR